jgi:hypothetical protein
LISPYCLFWRFACDGFPRNATGAKHDAVAQILDFFVGEDQPLFRACWRAVSFSRTRRETGFSRDPLGVTAVCTYSSDDSQVGLLVAERSLAAWSPKLAPTLFIVLVHPSYDG